MTLPSLPDYYKNSRGELLDFAKLYRNGGTAIDIGCASGRLGSGLVKAGIVSTCDGIEPVADAAQAATTLLRNVWHGSLESVASQIAWDDYNLVVMADVLEHLVDPWHALRSLNHQTNTNCQLLLSVPNVRHYKVSLPLLFKGKFQYQDHGIMDRTHLHFFTLDSLKEILTECGWRITHIGSNMKKRYRKRFIPTSLIEPFVAVQYLVFAAKQ